MYEIILLNFLIPNFIYIYSFFIELIIFLFEQLIIYNIFNYYFQKLSYIFIWSETTLYFLNYKVFIFSWLNLLNEYYMSFEFLSTRKAYGINFKLLMFNEYRESWYAWLPHSFIHTFVRFIYVVLYSKVPEVWIYGLHYYSFLYRLGWDLLGFYISQGDQYNIIEHLIYGFFRDSIYHKYYLGSSFNNIKIYYMVNKFQKFFKSGVLYFVIYSNLYIYYFVEFFFLKIMKISILIMSLLFKILDLGIIAKILILFQNIGYFFLLIYYWMVYLYYLYFDFFFEKIYILLYIFFFINIFLNFFLFIYNFFIYYYENLYTFLNMDIDFIKQNIFNYRYKLGEDWHPLGTWPTYVYKFEQYSWMDNTFKEYFLRNIFFYELKNLYFFKTFYTFFMHINRITFFVYLIYLFSMYRLFQYFLIFFNKWFFFTFFNTDWSISRNPELSWDKWKLYSKEKSYYFNIGLNNIIGGNLIWNYYYYNNNDLDMYIFNQKNQYLYADKINEIDINIKNYNNNLFFQNQFVLTKNLLENKIFKINYWNWYINSLIFFKNYQFFFYKNFDYLVLKYEKLYGSYSRSWVDKHNSHFINSLNVDKYNYIFLPPNARTTYIDRLSNEWFFYKNFNKTSRFFYFKNKNTSVKIKNFIKNNNFKMFMLKLVNYDELYNLRLQYPILMFWLIASDINYKDNNNFKYLFPFLITKKKIWLLYKDLFLYEKEKVKNLSTVPMSAEWLTFLNKSPLLPYLSIFYKLDLNLTYNKNNYKGIWNCVDNINSDLFLNYKGWDAQLVKYPKLIDMLFYKDFKKIDKIEYYYYKWLVNISKRYFNHLISVYHTNNWLYIPYIYEQNLFKNFKNASSYTGFEFNFYELDESGSLNYIVEMKHENPLEPLTIEEWSNILRKYTQNAFFLGDDDILLMQLYRYYVIHNYVNNINFISGFIFFFIPLYTLIIGTEIYFELCSGFIFEGGLKQPIRTTIVQAMEYYLSMADFDMQDERYFYINVIEQELLDLLTRFSEEIFYLFTKYFNSFNYLDGIKKNNILFNDEMLVTKLHDKIYDRKTYGRLFKSYVIKDKADYYLDEEPSRFLMQERKIFYTFSDLSYNLPFFDIKNNDNLFLFYYNYNFMKKYLIQLNIYKLLIFDLLKFFELPNNSLIFNKALIVYKNLYKNDFNLVIFINLYIKKINMDNFFFIKFENYWKDFFYLNLNKNKEYLMWFDKYFIWQNKYKEKLFLYSNSKSLNNQILALHMYNSYIDMVNIDIKVYKTFKLNNNLTFYQWYVLKNLQNLNDYSTNYTSFSIWTRVRSAWFNPFIYPSRVFILNFLDLDWFTKINYLPITSSYLKNFNGPYIILNNYFLSNYYKTYYLLNNDSIMYITKSKFFFENKKFWQFSVLLNDYTHLTIFPFFEFLLLLILLFIFLISICFIIVNIWKFEYVISKYRVLNYYYNNKTDKQIFFTKNKNYLKK